jgi:hypothetical protein
MTPIEFDGHTHVLAKDQPQYMPLPAHVSFGDTGRLTCCWQLTWRERWNLIWSGVIWHQILTFHSPLQPQLLLTKKPDLS